MSRLTVVFVLATFLCVNIANANEFPFFGGNFPFPSFDFPKINIPKIKPINIDDIKNLKPSDGGVVNGAAVSSSSTVENVNGVPVRKQQTRIITNDNGQVKEVTYDN
ncbi:uncharacterized protein LOC113518258 [Galleria mellonella]|uniref:Seroin 3 n=1 Tax=Galleria mellonella TaxID=7137 RepID=A0A3G1T150_GALME|nr:uncharacterized protein LOC113518258 [Galleria mellonella]AXY94624.1 seroin 3 [Galleria mellonella]